MDLSEHDRLFLEQHRSGAMITLARDGTPKVARVGVALVDGKVWSSATQDRVRTRRLRRDPRCTLYIHDNEHSWLALETTVTILDGPDAPELNLRLFRYMQHKPTGPLSYFGGDLTEEEFLTRMVEDQRLVYEFEVLKTYGLG
jgi:PPOX class probable F420-dependent enzyme